MKLNKYPLSLASPNNYMDLSDVSFKNKNTPMGEMTSPLLLNNQSTAVDSGGNPGPSEFESNIQSIVDSLKN